jgi:hypothetical protein
MRDPFFLRAYQPFFYLTPMYQVHIKAEGVLKGPSLLTFMMTLVNVTVPQGDTLRQDGANVWRKRVLQSRRALHESRNVGDLARKQSIQEIVLNKKDSISSSGQISCESGFACRHLSAEETQLC